MKSRVHEVNSRILSQLKLLIEVSGIKDQNLAKALASYHKRTKEVIDAHTEISNRPNCLFQWALLAENGDLHAKSFISFVDEQANELLTKLEDKFHPAVKKKLREMLVKIGDPTVAAQSVSTSWLVPAIEQASFI